MTPKCCQECDYAKSRGYKDGYCQQAKVCSSWLKWFRKEWQNIRKAAKQKGWIKEESKKGGGG